MTKLEAIFEQVKAAHNVLVQLNKDLIKLKERVQNQRETYAEIKQQLAEFAPYKVGERVMVVNGKRVGSYFAPDFVDVEAEVADVIVLYNPELTNIKYRYRLLEIKKDGTTSKKYLNGKIHQHDATNFKEVQS